MLCIRNGFRNGLVLVVALLTLFASPVCAASLRITWNACTEKDLAGYKVYSGTTSKTYGPALMVGKTTSCQVDSVTAGRTYYIAVSAYDSSGNESPRSTEASVTIPASADTTGPTGSVVINGGAASTSSRAVTLFLTASDAMGSVTGMRFSSDGATYSSEVAYASSYTWTLSSGSGTKTVYALFKDDAGNWSSSPATDTIQYSSITTKDTTPPTGSVVINSGAASTATASVRLTLSATDALGSVTGMRFSNDGATYSSEVAYASSCAWTLSSGFGTKTVYALFKDASGNWMSMPATDTIQYTNSCPVAEAGPSQTLSPQRAILDGSASADPMSRTLQYAWSQVSGPAQVLIETPSSVTASFMGIKAGTYRFQLACSCGTCTSTDTTDVIIRNVAPSVSAGSDRTVAAGSALTLHATGADPNEDALTYRWTKVSGPSVSLPKMNRQDLTFTPSAAGQYTFSVQCSDGLNTSAADRVIITVNAVNRAPTANAGANQDVSTGSTVTLNGTGSSDPDGDTLSYAWAQTSGTPVTLNGASTARPTFTATTLGTCQFTLVVNDGTVSSFPASVTIRVVDRNNPPVASAGQDLHAYVGDDVVLNASGSYDPDLDGLTFTWTQVSGASVKIFNASTIQAFFTPTTSGTFTFMVSASDGQASSTDTVTVTVDNANQVPIADAGSSITAAVGSTVVLDGTASHDPDKTAISYVWSQTSGTQVSLSNSNTARPSFVAVQEGVYEFELTVYDGQDTSSPSTVTVTVQGTSTGITLLTPANGAACTESPTLSWSGSGFKAYKVYLSIDNGAQYSKVYSGGKTSTALHAVLWQWFITPGTTVIWYVEGTTDGGSIVRSGAGTFIRR